MPESCSRCGQACYGKGPAHSPSALLVALLTSGRILRATYRMRCWLGTLWSAVPPLLSIAPRAEFDGDRDISSREEDNGVSEAAVPLAAPLLPSPPLPASPPSAAASSCLKSSSSSAG